MPRCGVWYEGRTEVAAILHPTKTKIVNVEREGFDFLGFHFIATTNYPRAKSVEELQTALRQKAKRTRGDSLHSIIRDLNQTLRGWYGYFQISRTGSPLPPTSYQNFTDKSVLRPA